ncbi:unnamed protein product [Didymodactylos carnosus]|uniref:Uncharacterized protein n=1 Tax=Didymodactylos carnosus TaxID=1234261 RepID=A0A814KJL4_9BILA|nr:unnamed protein product [Didymodactylos carnosus]CAF3821184.1 unnamed protein product [Didymodactylos carnosus]
MINTDLDTTLQGTEGETMTLKPTVSGTSKSDIVREKVPVSLSNCANSLPRNGNESQPTYPSNSENTNESEHRVASRSVNLPWSNAGTFLSSAAAIAIVVLVLAIFFFPYPQSCDMSKSENRDFNLYYGIKDAKNHFATATADDCSAQIIFTPALPQSILNADKSPSSFMILAEYGTGKTLLRCEYFKTLNSDHYLKILLLNKQISEYLERFITSRKLQDCGSRNCSTDWSDDEFAHLILSVLVTEFMDNYAQKQMKFLDIPIEEKINLVTIICYYYNRDNINQLEDFVNRLFAKSRESLYKASEAQVQIQERHIFQENPLLTHLKTDLNEFSILNKNIDKLHLLLAIIQGEGFQRQSMQKTMFGHVLRDLTDFSSFIKKHMKKITVFIIDGIDENQFLSQNNEVNKISLESFCRSSVSKKILSLTMANYFYLSIFYPKIDGINIRDAIVRPDKFPTYTLTWNSKSLMNYADYVLQELNKNASSTRCKSFTDFKTLVNYEKKEIAGIIDQIKTPRAIHLFLMELITQMSHDANNNIEYPFTATDENVRNAFEKSSGHYYKYDKAKG